MLFGERWLVYHDTVLTSINWELQAQIRFTNFDGTPFETKLQNHWLEPAIIELGVTSVSLYPGTKHSTVTALGGILTPEEIKRGGTGHQTSAAFERYMLPDMRDKIKIRQAIHQIRAAQPLHNQNRPAEICNLPKFLVNTGGGSRIRTGE